MEKKLLQFMTLARTISEFSKDPSTQVGALITRPDNTICSMGYNGFPSAYSDDPSHFEDKEFKYRHIIHAEENAILNSRDPSLKSYSIFIYGLCPCSSCFSKISQVGISNIFYTVTNRESFLKLEPSFKESVSLSNNTIQIRELKHYSLLIK